MNRIDPDEQEYHDESNFTALMALAGVILTIGAQILAIIYEDWSYLGLSVWGAVLIIISVIFAARDKIIAHQRGIDVDGKHSVPNVYNQRRNYPNTSIVRNVDGHKVRYTIKPGMTQKVDPWSSRREGW